MKLRRMMVSFLLLAALVGICVPVAVRADCSHSYENGFCTACGGYEEAVLNGDVYEISNAGQLYWFSELVTSGQTAVNAKLTQDIVVNEDLLSKIVVANDGTVTVRGDYTLREWLPIGSKDAKFEGTFDGNGKSLSGLYFDHQESTVALFRYIASGGTVKNVRILASCLAGGGTRGGIVDTNEGTVDNCSYAGYIGRSNSSSGGIVYSNRGTVVNCENEAIVRGQGYVGGIAGENLGKLENCRNIGETYGRSYVGGIAGLNGTNGEIISCLNNEWVSADSTTGSNNNVGGIVGSNSGTISQCGNSGQIVLLYGNIGGIVGWNGGAVTDCYNTGVIDSGYDNAGGIIGYHGSGASAVNCCNTGAVRPMACLYDWNGKYFGAIIGRNQNGTFTNCHYLKNSAQDRYNIYQQGIGCGTMGDYTPDISGQTAGKTSTQLASGEVTWLLNGSTSEGDLVWHQDIGTDAAPLFEGGVVYKVQTGGCKSGNYTYGYANEQLEAVFSHIEVTDEAVEATCTTDGLTEGKHCSACGEVLTAQETIPAPGHKDEVKDHNCDSCGEKLSDCAESVLHYYDHAIPVSAIDAANLKNSSYIRVIGVEEVLRRVDNIAQIAVDASALDGIIESEDFRTYAAEVLGVDIGSLNDKAWELAENLANTSGISLEEAVTELSHNMAAMYASHSAVAMDKAEITAFLTDPGSREILSDNLRHEESQNLGFTQAVLVYGMYTAYAYTREDDSLIANLDSLSIVLNAFDDPAFLEYTAGEQGGIDLNGYLSALNMIRECAENDAAAMELLAAGFNDGELKEAVQTMLDELDHTCDICGKVLSECQWGDSVVTSEPTCTQDGVKTSVCTICGAADTEPVPATGHTEVTDEAVEATCTETGLTEGTHCSVCGEVLVAQETIPALNHSDEDKDHLCDACKQTVSVCVDERGTFLPGRPDHKCDICGADVVKVTFQPAADGRSYQVTGVAEITVEGSAQTLTRKAGSEFTLTAPEGYVLLAIACETDGSQVYCDGTNTFTLPEEGCDYSVTPIFIEAVEAPFRIGTGTGAKYYYSWHAAFAAADAATETANKIVTLNSNHTLPTGEDALKYVLVEHSDYVSYDGDTGKTTYTIPVGTTLLVPYNAVGTCCTTMPTAVNGSYVRPSAFRTLSLAEGTELNVIGSVSLSAQMLVTGGNATGVPTNLVSFLNMAQGSRMTVHDGGRLYAYGFVTGSGSITVKSGAVVYEMLQFGDYRGANESNQMNKATNGVFPFSQYYLQNIEVPLTLEYGAEERVVTGVLFAGSKVTSSAKFFAKSDALFVIEEGSVTKSYDGAKDRLNVEVNGKLAVSPFSMKVYVTVYTKNFAVPLNSNITLKVNEGSTVTVNQDIAMLPGSELILSEGASCVINPGKRVYVYDKDQWGDYCGYNNKQLCPVSFAPSKTVTRTAAGLVDARVEVGGTLDATAGFLYTTSGGANICGTSSQTGKVLLTAGTQVNTYQHIQSGGDVAIPIVPAKLCNADGSYTDTVTAPYFFRDGVWQRSCNSENGEHTWKDADCTAPKTCSVCGATEGNALGHTEVIDETLEATCTETGLTEGTHCSVCGEVLVAQETIPALGHKDEVKDHRCDSCGEVLGSCVETALVYNGMTLPVSTADAAAVNNSILGTLDMDEMMNLAESLMNFLASMDSESLGVVYTNEEFQSYLAKCLGCEVDELMDMQKQFTDEEVNLILARAAILFAANNRDRVHPKAITNHLYNGNAISITLNWLHGTNGMTQDVNAAMAMATSTYGMLFTYANRLPEGAEKDEMMTIVANPLQAMTYVNDMDFRDYVRTEEGQQDLTGYLGIMGMLANSVRTPSVTKHILEYGFANETLKAGFAAVLENVDHNCDICGKVMSECLWDAGAVTTQPSCTEDGIKTMICTICGAADTEPVPATGHTEVIDEAVEATCTETGLTEGSHCSVCKAVLVAQEVVPTVGHSYTEAVTAPTCLEKGYTIYTCTCGDSYVGDYTDIVDHSFANGICQFCDLYEPAPDVNDDGVFEIYNAGNLYWLAELINGDEIAMNAVLMNDITVNENVLNSDGTLNGDGSNFRSWEPIGKNSNVAYIGTFDGSGYTISGLYVNGGNAIGLIGYLGSKGVVRDLTVADSWFSGGSQLGAVVGCSYGSVMNCTSTAAVSGTNYVGGIVGEGTAQDCRNQGAVNGEVYVGGIVGYGTAHNSTNNGAITGEDRTGGIIGKGNAYGCVNSGTVSGKTSTGGIVGHISSETISLCANAGTVTGTEYVGGIVGKNYGTVTDCYNTGSISGTRYVSGIAGLIQESGYSNYGTVANCYNTGTLSGNTNGRCIVGHNYAKGIITNCYYQAYSEKDDMEGTTYKSQLRFKTGEVTWLLNGSTSEGELVWYQDIGTDQMPQFEGGVVYRNQTGGCNEETYTYAYANEYKEPVFAHKDEDADNKCDACGELLRFDISYASMTMGNSLAMNFAFAKNAAADWTGYYAVIEKDYADGRENAVQTVPFADWKTAGIGGVAHYYVTFNGIAAKEMMDNVYVTIYNADGEAVSDTWTDSVCAQAMRNLAKDTISAEEKTMVVDMLNYGAAAQEEFGYNTTCLANALLSEEQKALATESTSYEDTHIGEGSYVASNLMLKSNIQLMFAFRNVTSDMKAVVTFTNHRGVAKNITIEGSEFTKSGSLSIVTVEDMVVADSRQDITCTIYDGEEVVATITDSVESYATRKSNTLFEMLMRFSDSAYAYFH